MKNPKLGASVLSVPNFFLQKKIIELYNAGIDYFHIDIMDGNFVPNLSVPPSLYQEIYETLPLFDFDLHFMVTEKALQNILSIYLQHPPKYVTIHLEAVPHWIKYAKLIKEKGSQFGLAINPDTDLTIIKKFLPELDLVLLMSVEPGFGGQKFKEATYEKLQMLAKIRENNHLSFLIQIDGGINPCIGRQLIKNGVDLLVIGSDLITDPNPASYKSRIFST